MIKKKTLCMMLWIALGVRYQPVTPPKLPKTWEERDSDEGEHNGVEHQGPAQPLVGTMLRKRLEPSFRVVHQAVRGQTERGKCNRQNTWRITMRECDGAACASSPIRTALRLPSREHCRKFLRIAST
eukprot:7406170-Pyramimonas_sp.AAC.1